jgi:hypothetical protein
MKGNESSLLDVLMELEIPNLGKTEGAGGFWRNERGPQFKQKPSLTLLTYDT